MLQHLVTFNAYHLEMVKLVNVENPFKGVLGILQPKDRYFREFACVLDLTVLSHPETDFNELGCFREVRHSSFSLL